MFGFLKRRAALTEADFDIVADVTVGAVTMSKSEIVQIFLDWTQDASKMTKHELGRKIVDRCVQLKSDFGDKTLADRDVHGRAFAQKLIEQLQGAKMIKNASRKTAADFLISSRGEQIRQFYVMKLDLRGSVYDRMDRFEAA